MAAKKTDEPEVVAEDPAPANTLGYYEPTPEQRAENRRHSALDAAVRLRAPGAHHAESVVKDASLYLAFLTGEPAAATE